MAYEIGGRADKYGNRFEYNWVVYKLLDVIEEKSASVILEALGKDEAGIDLWVVDHDGNREGQQCKGRDGSEEHWTYASINAKGLWQNWKNQLDRGENISVSLVSPLAFTQLEDITVRARNNNGNPEDFYKIQILQSGQKMRTFFNNVCKVIGVNPNDYDGCKYILSYFKRISYRQYPDSELKLIDLSRISQLFVGNPESIYSLMIDYVLTKDIYGKDITAFMLNEYLISQGITFRNLANDSRILPRIQELNEEYKKSFNMFSTGMICRDESESCWEYIKQGKSIVIHGQAGAGKSGCTTNIISLCEQESVPYLAIKLDKRIPINNTEAWSYDMGLPASISHCIDSVARDKNAVIILDQLDALRWTQAHSGLALTVCMQLIRELRAINYERKYKISLVFVCRTYDLENDSGIKGLFVGENENESIWEKISIGFLNEEEIKQVVGIGFDGLSSKIRNLLKVASNLYIWEKLDGTQNNENIEATYQLVNEWWNQIVAKSRINNLESEQIEHIKDTMVSFCENRGRITVPNAIARIPQDYKSFLISNGFVIESNAMISFTHQSILDCFLAEQMIQKYYVDKPLIEIIGDKDRQTPGRRYQVQIFLQQLAEISEEDFLKLGLQILEHNYIRYSFKYVFLEVLSQNRSPKPLTVEFVLALLKKNEWKMPVINTVIRSQKTYINRMIGEGLLDDWMASDSQDTVINLFASLSPDDYGYEEISFIRKYALSDSGNRNWVTCFYRDINEGSEELFELRIDFYKKYPEMLDWYIDLKKMLLDCEIRTIRIIALMLEFAKRKHERTIHKYAEELSVDDAEVFIRDYRTVLNILVPYLPEIDNYSRFDNWSGRYYEKNNLERTCILIIKSANREFIKRDPDGFLEYYAFCFGKGNNLYNEIILDAIQYIEKEYADYVLDYLQSDISKNCFEDSSGNGNKLYYAKKIVEKYSEFCSENVLRKFENTVIHYTSPKAMERLKWRIEQNHEQKKSGGIRVYWDFWGDFQYEILSSINAQRRCGQINQLLVVLERKYKGKTSIYDYSYDSRCCSVVSPVSGKSLSAKSWMKIIMNPKIKEDRKTKWMYDKGVCIESSLEEFSMSFRRYVSENPIEILDLFLGETSDIQECYVDGLFGGLSSSNQTENICCDKIEQLVRKFGYNYTSYRAAYICEIVEKNAEKNWSDYMITCIVDIAINHTIPEIDNPVVTSSDDKNVETVELLESNALNSVRGYAVRTIAKLLWENDDYYAKFKECIQELSNDNNPIINYATLWALWPIYNIDKTWAVEKIMSIFAKNHKMIGFHDSRRMFCYCYAEYSTTIVDAINKAVQTQDKRLLQVSGYSIVELYMIYDEYKDLLNIYRNADKDLRRAMLDMLIIYFGVEKYKEKAKEILTTIIDIENDLDNDVLWGKLFRDEMLDIKNDADLIKRILGSKIKRRTLMDFAEYIAKQGDVKEYSDLIIEGALAILEKDQIDANQLWGIDAELSKLIIGLYDVVSSSNLEKDKNIARECLNVWDKMYECNVGMARLFTNQMMEV